MVSVSGDIGYEYSYAPHIITNIDKATGRFETELIENVPVDDYIKEYIEQETISETREFDYSGGVLRLGNSQVCKEHWWNDS